MGSQRVRDAVAVARALGHPARLRAVAMLRSGDLCMCQLAAALKLAPSTVSSHLRELRLSGVTVERKDGRFVHVGLSADPGVRSWIEPVLAMVANDDRVTADDRTVRTLRDLPLEDLCRFGFEAAQARQARRLSPRGRGVARSRPRPPARRPRRTRPR